MITYGSTTLTSYNSIVKTEIYYYQSTSSSSQTGGSWSTNKPTWANGKYVWQKIRTYYEGYLEGGTATTDGSGQYYTESTPVNITGQQGATGDAAYSYKLNASDTAVTVSKTGEYSVNKITFTTTYKQGTGAVTAYAGRFKIETTLNGTTWTTVYTSSGNESSKQYTLPENIISIRCSLYQAGGTSILLDITTIPIVKDGIDAIGLRDSIPYYLASDKQIGVTRLDQGWTRFKPELTTEKRYLWVYYVSRYSEGDTQPELIEIKNDVINFENHGDESPVEDYIVDINPVQDLHGYDSPWIGGNGINKLNLANVSTSNFSQCTLINTENGSVRANIQNSYYSRININSNSGTLYNELVTRALNGQEITFEVDDNYGKAITIVIYGERSNGSTYLEAGGTGNKATITPSLFTSINYFEFRFLRSSSKYTDTTTIVTGLRISYGSTATTYTPYENICPISGWTNINIQRLRKNIIFKKINNVYPSASGKIDFNSSYDTYIGYIEKDKNYVIAGNTDYQDGTGAVYAFYSNLPDINSISYNNARTVVSTKAFKAPITGYIALRAGISDSFVQIEEGTTSTTYEPYQENIYNIQFPSEAGTVYGGTLDVTTGRLTVDKGTITVNGNSNIKNPDSAGSCYIQLNSMLRMTDYRGSIVCDSANTAKSSFTLKSALEDAVTGYPQNSYYANQNWLYLKFGDIVTSAAMKEFLSNHPINVIYPLAEPIIYQLTPQEITMLTGQNYIFSNCGQTAISYYDKQTSTDPYIDYSATSAFEVAQSVSDAIGVLESPYKEVEWVESNGKQYVYLDWKPPIKTWGFEIDFISRNAVNSSQGAWNESTNANGYGTIFGVRNASGVNNAQLSSYNNGLLRLGNGNNVVAGFKTDHSRQTIKLHGTTLTKTDGTTTTVTRTDENTSKPYCNMTVFCLYEGLRRASTGSISEPSSTRIYSLKFYDGDTLTVDLVGAIRKADNITGLYDKVSKHFYPAPRMSFGNDVGDIPITDTITDALNKNDVKCTVVNKNCSRMWETAVPFNRLEDGQKITITYSYGTLVNSVQTSELVGWDDTWSNSNVYLRLIYPDGVKSEWIPCYYSQTGRLTTHYGAGTPITLTYHENILSNATETAAGSSIVRGFFANANYDTNTSYTQYSPVKAGVNGIKGYTLAMRDSENTWSCFYSGAYKGTGTGKVAYTGGFILGKVIYSTGAGAQTSNSSLDTYYNYKEGVVTSTNYDAYPVDFRYSTNCATTLIAQRPVYLVGTVESDGLFHLDASQWWTQTEPTFKDNKVYVYLGVAYSTYQIWLSTDNPAYMFYNDKFILYDRALTLQDIDSLKETLESQIDGKVETWCQKSNPATNWSAEERPSHTGDLWYYIGESTSTYKNNTTYQYNGNTNTWTAYSANPDLFDKIDGKTAIYYGTQSSVTSAEEGDYLVDSTDGSSYRWNNSAWVKVTDYKTAINNIQIGGRNLLCNSNQSLTTVSSKGDFYLSETIPTGTTVIASVQIDADDIVWATTDRCRIGFEISQSSDGIATGTQYVGVWWGKSGTTNNGADINYNTSSTGATSYHGRIWSKVTLTRPFLADIKRGGIYVQGITSGTYKISNPKVEIATKPSDWTPAPEDVEEEISNFRTDLQSQIDEKIQTYYQSTNPASSWTTAETRAPHDGDLWYYTGTSTSTYTKDNVYRYNASNNTWSVYSASGELFDKVDGKSTIYYGTTSGTYTGVETGDYLVDSTDGSSYRWDGSKWVKVTDYKTAIDNIEIGGRNLLKGTATGEGWTYTSFDSNTKTFTRSNSTLSEKYIQSGWATEPLQSGQEYTISCWMKTNGYVSSVDVFIVDKNVKTSRSKSYPKTSLSTEWQYYKTVLKTIDPLPPGVDLNNWYVRFDNNATTENGTEAILYVKDIKLEKGNKATDWTPAPEDTTASIQAYVDTLQFQVDHMAEIYYGTAVPTLSNTPASSWNTNDIKDIHVDDLYYNTSTGYCYRFTKSGSTYSWTRIKDSDITAAATAASNANTAAGNAQTTANNANTLAGQKRRIFVAQPTPPYEVGDLWVEGSNGDIKKCKTARATGSYTASDWELASKYTDDTLASEANDKIDNLEVGGRNLLRRDPKYYSATSYGAYDLALTEPLEADQKYIIQLWDVDVSHTGKTADQLNVAVYYCGGTITFGKWQGTEYFTDGHADYLTFSFTPTSGDINHANVTSAVIKFIRLYNSVSSASGTMNMHVGKWKIEKGDKATDWSIAPEDMVRGTGFYSITTAPTSYTTATGGFTPAYRIALSTVKTESGLEEVMVGDVIQQGYNTYPVGYVDTSYVYLGAVNSIRGATGAAGLNTARVILYRRFASAPTGTNVAPTGDVTYTFSTGIAANNLNSWTQDIPSGTDPVYMIAATASASSTDTTDKILKTEWSEPIKILENGKNGNPGGNGSDGYNQATIYLYQRKSGTAPSKPSSAVTYTFSTGALSSTPTGWSRTIPANDGNPCYVTTAVAFAKTTTYSIPANGWSDVVILSQDGADGTSITITSTSVKYQKGTSGTTKPTGTWGTSIPTIGENEYLWTQTIVNYSDNSKTESYSVSRNAKNGTSPTVSSSTVEYQQADGGTTPPTGTWSTTAPSATAGKYMWTKTTVTYSDGKTAVSYSVSKNGTNGTNGINGTSQNLLLDVYATSLTKVTAPWSRYLSDGGNTTITGQFIAESNLPDPNATHFYRITDSSATNKGRGFCFYEGGTPPFISGHTYKVGCWVRKHAGQPRLYIYLGGGMTWFQHKTIENTDWEWMECVRTFGDTDPNVDTQGGTYKRLYFYLYNSNVAGSSLDMCGFKVEEVQTDTSTARNYLLDTEKMTSWILTNGTIMSNGIATFPEVTTATWREICPTKNFKYEIIRNKNVIFSLRVKADIGKLCACNLCIGVDATETSYNRQKYTNNYVYFTGTGKWETICVSVPISDEYFISGSGSPNYDNCWVTVRIGALASYHNGYQAKEPQFSLGTTATAWSAAPEDIEASMQDKVDNIEIGGKNLLLNTAKMTTWNKGTGEVTLTDEYALLQGTDADWGSRIDSRKLALSLLDGETNYILSFEYKSSIDTINAPIMIAGTNYTKEDNIWGRTKYCAWSAPNVVLPNTNGEWKKFTTTSRTITLSNLSAGNGDVNSWYLQMYVRTNNANLYVRKFQLEKGNKSTDWTLAPEDIDSNIQQVQDNLDNLKIGGRNLLSKDKIIPYTTSFTEENYVYTGNCGAGGGLKIPSSLFTVGTSYVLSFKFKKISGTLKGIGGHSGGFTNNKFIVDGVIDNSRPYNSGHVMSDDTVEHTVEAYFTFNNDHATDNNLYIQPNRNSYTSSNDSQFQFWDIQLEIGDKATDWTPAPEDTDASIQQVQDNLDNLEIGGRNLFRNSKTLSRSWAINQATITDGIATVAPTASGDRRIYQMPAAGCWTWTVGQEYTVSIDARSDNGASFTFVATGVASDGTAITSPAITATSDWKRYSFTFTAVHSSTGSMTFSIVEASSKTIQFKEPKLEYGGKATSWTPAPEDTQASIDSAQSTADEALAATQPLYTKTYTGLIGSANDYTNASFYFAKIHPTNYTTNYKVKMKVRVTAPEAYAETIDIQLGGYGSTFSSYDSYTTRTGNVGVYYINLYRATQAGISTNHKGHALGVGLRSSTNPTNTSYKRTIIVDILELENCTIEMLDTAVKYANIDGTGSTNYSGLTEMYVATAGQNATNNANTHYTQYANNVRAGVNGIKGYTLIMQDSENTWSCFCVGAYNGTTNSGKSINPDLGFIPGKVLYSAGAGAQTSNSSLDTYYNYKPGVATSTVYDSYNFDLRYSTMCGSTLVTYKPVYLVGIIKEDGLFYFEASNLWWTQTEPTEEDGKVYIFLGMANSTTTLFLNTENPAYVFYDGKFMEYKEAQAEKAKKTATNYMSSDNTGIMVADLKDGNFLPGDSNLQGKNVYITAGYTGVDPGVYIRDGQTNLAMFGENVRIGKDSSTHGYLYEDYHSLQLVDKERYTYFYVSDLRNAEGYVSLIDTFDGDGIKTSFDLSFTANSTDYTVEVSDNSGGTITKAENWFSFSEAPTANSTITVSYNSESYSLKAYTLGKRKSNERVGGMSVAEGLSTIAKGHYSHAEGLQTEANRYCSHTEGFQTIANGHSAHAENYMTHADGWASHAEGGYTFAKGEYCHAEGGGTEAYGANSHAEGRNTLAKGNYSHAQNRQTIAYGSCQTVIGRYNQEDSEANPNDTTQYGKYALIIGNGNNLQQRSNALCVDWDGNVELALKTSASSGTDDANLYSVLTTLGWQNDVIV